MKKLIILFVLAVTAITAINEGWVGKDSDSNEVTVHPDKVVEYFGENIEKIGNDIEEDAEYNN